MEKEPLFDYGDFNAKQLIYTGLNGWINPVTRTVRFCKRCQHLDMIKYEWLDGVPPNWLNAIREEKDDPDCKVDYDVIFEWVAGYNWYHFINMTEHETDTKDAILEFNLVPDELKNICKKFALEWFCGWNFKE